MASRGRSPAGKRRSVLGNNHRYQHVSSLARRLVVGTIVGALLAIACKVETATSCGEVRAMCGAEGKNDCCESLRVPGGTFNRGYDGVLYNDANYPATVSDFRLDKYEVTVGRFRAFVKAGLGTQKKPPGEGS